MAFEGVLNKIPGLIAQASATLATKQNLLMKMKGASYPLEVVDADAGEKCIGVLQNKPTAGAAATVAGPGSVCKLLVGSGGLDAGDLVAADTNGKGVTAADGDWIAAMALDTTTTEDELATVLILSPSLGIDDDT